MQSDKEKSQIFIDIYAIIWYNNNVKGKQFWKEMIYMTILENLIKDLTTEKNNSVES